MLDFTKDGEFSVHTQTFYADDFAIDSFKRDYRSKDWSLLFRISKSTFDCICVVIALPFIATTCAVLLLLNPWFNSGPLFFHQTRMGRDGKPFRMWKFRTMTASGGVEDGADREAHEKLEEHRITPLGRFLRKVRIDEWPNFFNVLRGEMSVVGPRPDAYHHAAEFAVSLPGYTERHRVRPGITGLAQVEMGYAEGLEQTALKSQYDNIYASRSCGRMELYIIAKTFAVVLSGAGR